MTVTTPDCGCCNAWSDLALQDGFDIEIIENIDPAAFKRTRSVPHELISCHSTVMDDDVAKKHARVDANRKLMAGGSEITGIAAPGLPAFSPCIGDDPNSPFEVIASGNSAGGGEYLFCAGA
ncbi:Protein of unknown function, DUF [Roseovarius nanhaiticus]|uniref:Uncharacterized protein n=1 Tax=Roseovarius nanhaiticus TaxID=573024 RepID=A0A1N7G271_9RHOB|nr:DUF411 domain-containing protein [Roseovarius nanhaiticus]SEK39195.1 Protein of unknown function, DUF [Roseovarius nanhaiticus]SIS06667.1 Protein of unknown function, DUF [Roseovarius nanhaiticus]